MHGVSYRVIFYKYKWLTRFFSFQMWTNVLVTHVETGDAGTESGTTGASASTDGQASTVINVCFFCYETHESFIFSPPYKFLIYYKILVWISGCENGGDVVFAIDSSGSIDKDNFKELLSVVIDIAERLEIDKANTNDRGFRLVWIWISQTYNLLSEYL